MRRTLQAFHLQAILTLDSFSTCDVSFACSTIRSSRRGMPQAQHLPEAQTQRVVHCLMGCRMYRIHHMFLYQPGSWRESVRRFSEDE